MINKKGDASPVTTLGSILLVIIILVLLLLGGGNLLWQAANKSLHFIDDAFGAGWFGNQTSLSTLDQNAQNSFNLLINDYKTCKSKSTKSCKCINSNSVGFGGLTSISELDVLNTNKLRLYFISGQNRFIKADSDIDFPSCYVSFGQSVSLAEPIAIRFDQDKPYLQDNNGLSLYFTKGYPSVLYKNQTGDLCWLTSDAQAIQSSPFC